MRGADRLMDERFAALDRAADGASAPGRPRRVEERIAALQTELRETKRRLREGGAAATPEARRSRRAGRGARSTASGSSAPSLDLESIDALKGFAKDVRGALPSGVIALGLDADEPQLFVTVSDDLVARGIAAGSLVSGAVTAIDGRGGGRPEMAQGKGTRREGLGDAIAAVRAAAAARAGAA